MADFHHPKLRLLKGDELTHQELDNNINSFYYSSSLDGSNIKLYAGGTSGSFFGYTQSYDVNAFTASHATSASYADLALTASYAISSSVEVTLEHSSSYAESASFADNTNTALSASHFADGVISASVNLNTLILTKADNSTLSYLIHTGSGEANPDGIISSSAQIALLNAGIVSASAQIRDRLVSAGAFTSASNASIRATLGTNQFILSGSKPDTNTLRLHPAAGTNLDYEVGGEDLRLQAVLDLTGSVLTETGSVKTRLNTIEAATSSYALITDISGSGNVRFEALNAATSSYALKTDISGSGNIRFEALNAITGSLIKNAALSGSTTNTIRFTQQDDSTIDITINTGSSPTSIDSASHAEFADLAHVANSATTATSASHSEFADLAHVANSATTATTATSASHSEFADLAHLANSATTATSASAALYSVSGSHALKANSANANYYSSSISGDTLTLFSYNGSHTIAIDDDNDNTFRTVEVDTDGDDTANNTLTASETLRFKKGANITLAEAGGVITISADDDNTFRTIKVDTNNDGTANETIGATEQLKLVGGSNVTLAEDAGKVTISANDDNTFRTVEVDTNGDNSANNTLTASETLRFKKGSNITLAEAGGVITISAAGTAATDLSKTVSGTGFSINSSTGDDVALSLATTDNWGIMSDEMFDKLDGIEALADVTDATNVTAAGALMDSELTNLAAVKAINQSLVTGASPQFVELYLEDSAPTLYLRSSNTTVNKNTILGEIKFLTMDDSLSGTSNVGTIKVVSTSTYTGSSILTDDYKIEIIGNLDLDRIASGSWHGDVIASDKVTHRTVTAGGNTVAQSETLAFTAGTGVTISEAGGAVTINASNNGTVTEVTVGTGLDVANGTTTPTMSLDLSELTDMTAAVVGTQDELILLDNGAERRKQISEITLSDFNNDSGWTSNAGTVGTSGTPVDNDFAKFTNANTVEGRSYSEVRSDLGLGTIYSKDYTTTIANGSGDIPDGDAVYDHVTSRLSGYVDTSGTPAAQQVALFTDANTISGSTNLKMHVNGSYPQFNGLQVGDGGTANLYLGNAIDPSSANKGARFHSNDNDFYFDFQGDATQNWYLRDYDGSGGTHTRFTFDFINSNFAAATATFSGNVTANNFVTTSDRELKDNIVPIKEGLETLKKFVSYEYELEGKKDAGFIAQEVEESLSYAVHKKQDGYLALDTKPILAHMHKAILEIDQRLSAIEDKLK